MDFNKIVLGTAQIDTDYGVAREKSNFNLGNIINICKNESIAYLDTAEKYSQAHSRLSNLIKKDFKIITKISFANIEINDLSFKIIEKKIEKLFTSLKSNHIDCILLHETDILKTKYADFLIQKLIQLKDQNKIKKFGISIYEIDELESFYEIPFDVIQGPLNILDQRIIHSGWLKKISQDNKEFHARSIFLQGLLSQNLKKDIPQKFLKWEAFWNEWFIWHQFNKIKPIQTCLSFIINNKLISKAIIGVDNEEQLNNLIYVCKYELLDNNILKSLMKKTINDKYLVNPKNWKSF